MYKDFIEKIEKLTENFKKTGEIEEIIELRSHLEGFLESAIGDYLQEDL